MLYELNSTKNAFKYVPHIISSLDKKTRTIRKSSANIQHSLDIYNLKLPRLYVYYYVQSSGDALLSLQIVGGVTRCRITEEELTDVTYF
jgi:hypothetical protein